MTRTRTDRVPSALALLAIAVTLTAAAPPAPAAPAPVPAQADRAAAEKLIREVFAADLARRAPADQAAAAKKLLAEADKERADKAAKYALLDDARDLALSAGDTALAWRAIDALADAYQVDRAALRADALAALAKSAALTPPAAIVAAGHSLAPVDALCAADDYAAAQRAVAQADAFAARARDAVLQTSIRARAAEVRSLAAQFDRAKPALEKLKADPDDADANGAAGSFHCFAKGDWKAGLPLLAKSADPALKALAAADLAAPRTPDARKALADRWWDAADAKGVSAASKPALRRRAAAWYEQAAPGLTGLGQALARKRIAEAGVDPTAAARRTIDLLAMTDPKHDAVNGAWSIDKGTLVAQGGGTVRLQLPYYAGEEYDLRVTYAYTTGGEGMMTMLPSPRGPVLLVTNPKNLYFEDVTGTFGDTPHEPIARGEPHTLTVRVRKARVQAMVDDHPVYEFDPATRRMGLQTGWRVRDDRSPGLGNWNTTIVYSKIEVTEVTGAGQKLR